MMIPYTNPGSKSTEAGIRKKRVFAMVLLTKMKAVATETYSCDVTGCGQDATMRVDITQFVSGDLGGEFRKGYTLYSFNSLEHFKSLLRDARGLEVHIAPLNS